MNMMMLLDDSRVLYQAIAVALFAIGTFSLCIRLGERLMTFAREKDQLPEDLPCDSDTVHLIVLMHGLQNTPKSLEGLYDTLKKQAANNVVVYRSSSNVGRTTQGLMPCAKRLAEEINSLVEQLLLTKNPSKITLSLFGNSLGGLIARAALPDIQWKKNDVSIHPNLFCTTNSPHLGSRGTLLYPLPTYLQYLFSILYGVSMQDLFRYTDAMDQIHSKPHLQLLQQFSKRIAYTTTYQTDFQVPTETAVFLSSTKSVHKVIPDYGTEQPFVIGAASTPKTTTTPQQYQPNDDDQAWIDHRAQLLDSLGWTKVFCDCRCTLPSISTAWSSSYSKMSSRRSLDKDQQEFTSKELQQFYCQGTPNRFYPPMGHAVFTGMLAGMKFNNDQTIIVGLATQMLQDIKNNTN